ncbi:hypothetical protein F4777DRAFT_508047 [Nemania sp. FL0916]|nr:hypothetical protein F4777DRAFT_508047 [Nemania sp. FL0916]
MNPSGAPQPPREAAYETEGNPATLNPYEERVAHSHEHGRPIARRVSGNHSLEIQDAVPSSLAWGIHGGAQSGQPQENAERRGELEGGKMTTPAEGRVADAVDAKPGATGSQPDLASELDRKKSEQAEARNAIKEERRHGKISDGAGGGVDT